MDPVFVVILVVVAGATVAWVLLRGRAEADLTPEERLQRAALRAEQDRQRTSAIEAADRHGLNGPPNP